MNDNIFSAHRKQSKAIVVITTIAAVAILLAVAAVVLLGLAWVITTLWAAVF